MTIELLTKENFEEANVAMSTAFTPAEGRVDPITHLLGLRYQHWHKLIDQWMPSFIEDGVSFICRDVTGKCVGGMCCEDYAKLPPANLDLDPEWATFFQLIKEADEHVPFKPGPDAPRRKVLHLFLGSILPLTRDGDDYFRRAVNACLLEAFSQGYTHYLAEPGSAYSERLVKTLAPHHLVATFKYKEWKHEGIIPFFDHADADGHNELTVYYGSLLEIIQGLGMEPRSYKAPADANVGDKIESSLMQRFQEKFPVSWGLYKEYRLFMPGGNTKSICWTKPYPLPILRGRGSKVVTHENEELLDFICAYGSILHGHCHPMVDAAAHDSINNGILYSLPTQSQSLFASAIMRRIPSLDGGIRFVSSGSEAVMFCLRLARHYRKKDKHLMFQGAYHGSYDLVIAYDSRGSGSSIMKATGIPHKMCEENVIIGEFNDVEGVRQIIRSNADDLACVLVEPFMGACGCIKATQEFIDMIFEETKKFNILTVFDEITSARSAYGGMQEVYNVKPDLTTFGKLFGGGHPLGGYGGRRDIMNLLDPEKVDAPMLSSGSFFGHDIAMRAGIATLQLFDRPVVDEMVRKMTYCVDKLRAVVEKAGIKIQILHTGALSYIHYNEEEIVNGSDARRDVFPLHVLTYQALIVRNILVTPRLMLFISTVTSIEEIDQFSIAFEDVLKEIKPLIQERYPQLIV